MVTYYLQCLLNFIWPALVQFYCGFYLWLPTSLRSSTPDNLDEIIDIAIAAEFHAENVDSTNHAHYSRFGRDLHQRESDSLFELYVASRALVEPLELEAGVSCFNG